MIATTDSRLSLRNYINMGCNPSSMANNSLIPNMEKMYSDARLPHPDMIDLKNPFEKELF